MKITKPINIKTFSKDESNEKVTYMKLSRNNEVIDCTVEELATIIGQGFSFYPAEHKLLNNTITDASFISSQLLVADVDHANLDLSEIRRLASQQDLEISMIYYSQSSTDETRKYRVLFQLNRLVSREEFEKAQKFIIWTFGKDYYKEMCVDASPYNAGRIYYTAKANNGVIYSTNDAINDVDMILAKVDQFNVEEVHEDMVLEQQKYKTNSKSKDGSKSTKKSSSKKKKDKDEDKSLSTEEWEARAKQLVERIQALKETHQFPQCVDITECQDFINHLPLNEILGVKEKELFSCYLHKDSTPSANILYDEERGSYLYHCFSCGSKLNTFTFIHKVFHKVFNHTLLDTERMIFSLLGVERGSKYQKEAVAQLDANLKWTFNIITKKDDSDVAKALRSAGRITILKAMYELGKYTCPMTPMTKKDEKCAHLFVSLDYIKTYLNEQGFIRGFKDAKEFGRKVALLCEYGLIERIEFDSLTEANKKKAIELRDKTAKNLQINKKESVKVVYYYRLNFISDSVLENMRDVLAFNKRVGKKTTKSNKKRLAGVNAVLADQVYQQSSFIKDKYDKVFVEDATAFINKTLEEKGWFTRDEMLDAIDPKRNYFKSNKKTKKKVQKSNEKGTDQSKPKPSRLRDKEKYCDDLFPSLVVELNLSQCTVNKESRQEFNIPNTIKSNSKIFIKQKN